MNIMPETIWITKYALTKGILKYDKTSSATIKYDERRDIISIKEAEQCLPCFYHGRGKEWFDNFEDAKKEAEKMKLHKIENLEKKLEKLKRLTFNENC